MNNNTTKLTEGQINYLETLLRDSSDNYMPSMLAQKVQEIESSDNVQESFQTAIKAGNEAVLEKSKDQPLKGETWTTICSISAEHGVDIPAEPQTQFEGIEILKKLRYDLGLNKATTDQYHECKRRLEHAGLDDQTVANRLKGLTIKGAQDILGTFEKVPPKQTDKATPAQYGLVLNRMIQNGVSEEAAKTELKFLSWKDVNAFLEKYPPVQEAAAV